MLKHILEAIGDVLIIVFGIISLYLFIDILQHGIARYAEPSMTILIGEIVFASLIVLIGAERLVDDLRK